MLENTSRICRMLGVAPCYSHSVCWLSIHPGMYWANANNHSHYTMGLVFSERRAHHGTGRWKLEQSASCQDPNGTQPAGTHQVRCSGDGRLRWQRHWTGALARGKAAAASRLSSSREMMVRRSLRWLQFGTPSGITQKQNDGGAVRLRHSALRLCGVQFRDHNCIGFARVDDGIGASHRVRGGCIDGVWFIEGQHNLKRCVSAVRRLMRERQFSRLVSVWRDGRVGYAQEHIAA